MVRGKSLEIYEFFLNGVVTHQATFAYRFGRFVIDVQKRLLSSGDEIINLTPKAFDTLLVLVEREGTVLTKTELMRLVWPDQYVEENNLAQHIHSIRKALGAGPDGKIYIETIPKRGYRFVGKVERRHQTPAGQGISEQLNPVHAGHSGLAAVRTVSSSPRTSYAVSSGDVSIAYQVVGDGPIDLIFVMGWVSHIESFWQEPSFARFLERLASFSRLILFDKRGTGLSDAVPLKDLPTLEQRMTDVQAVMDAVGSKRAVLLGVSEGGPICSLFAASHPERTLALIMIGTYAKRVWSEDYPWAPTAEENARFLEEVKKNWGGAVGLEQRAPSVSRDPQFREWWATYLRLGASPGAAAALTTMNAEIDVRDVLPTIGIPTLVIHRKDDICLPAGGGQYVASRIPGAKYVELDGSDHLPFVGSQEEMLDEIEEFLTGARSGQQVDRVLATVLVLLFDDHQSPPVLHAEMMRLLRSHLLNQLSMFKGKHVELTTEHLFATFDGPARAIRCARALIDAAARLGLRVHAGLHTGECDLVDDAPTGLAPKIGSAIAELGSPGEILVSHTVKDLVAGSGLRFQSRNDKVSKELSGEWRIFSVARSNEAG